MRVADLEAVVTLHLEAFPNFFLTFMGAPFLRVLYWGILKDASGITFVFERKSQILGFVAGTVEPSGFYTRLLRSSWWRFGLASIVPILRRPATLIRISRAFGKYSEHRNDTQPALLMSIAVHTAAQQGRIGFQLVEAFVEQAGDRGAEQLVLTTDRDNNGAVNKFYQARGFSVVDTYCTPEGRWMNKYVRGTRKG